MVNFQQIKNAICVVHFAGWQSDTLTLQKNGWQLSMEQLYDRASLRLALHHEALRLYALSAEISYQTMLYMRPGFNEPEKLEFRILYCASNIQLNIPERSRPSFTAIDAIPQFEERRYVNFKDAIPFRPLNNEAPEIVIAQNSVPELMEMILKLQDPKQAAIRENRRKEAWRNGGEGMRLSEGYKPAADIRAQILTLAS